MLESLFFRVRGSFLSHRRARLKWKENIFPMKSHYLQIVAAAEKAYERYRTLICTDENSLYRGALDNQYDGVIEPGTGSGFLSRCCSLYSCKESRYCRDPELLAHIENACDMILRSAHEDGTHDFLATNYYTPATFEIIEFCRGYKNFVRYMDGTEAELKTRDKMKKALGHWARGCLNGGFHTPNHRWVECAAMAMSYNILGWPELLTKINSYLSEGIDCDEYGEFTERSMGTYNPINDNAMMIMADELGKTELYEYAKRNMELTFSYLEADGTIFTRNSRRQDSGQDRVFPCHIWYHLYLWAGELFGEKKFLKFAQEMYDTAIANGLGAPGYLWLYLERPQLKDFEPDLTGATLPTEYHSFYPNSRILRVRKGDFSYTLLSRNPDFMHIKFGSQTMTVRMCSSFFAVAQFEPETIMKTETGYRMTFRGHGEYKGLFPEPPASPDWDKMNHSLRPVIHSCDLDYTLDVTDREDGADLRIQVDNTPRVPFKLEFVLPAGIRLETDQVMLDTTSGGQLTIKEGDMRIEDLASGSEVTVRGLFAEHMYHKNMRGSIPPRANSFTVYSTGFSPIDREIRIRFSKRAEARPMHKKV